MAFFKIQPIINMKVFGRKYILASYRIQHQTKTNLCVDMVQGPMYLKYACSKLAVLGSTPFSNIVIPIPQQEYQLNVVTNLNTECFSCLNLFSKIYIRAKS